MKNRSMNLALQFKLSFAQIVLNRSQFTWPLRHFLLQIIFLSHKYCEHLNNVLTFNLDWLFCKSKDFFCNSIFCLFLKREKLEPCIESINQNRLSESCKQTSRVSVAWKILKAYFNQQGVSCRWCLVGNCATCIVRSFSFVFFIDFFSSLRLVSFEILLYLLPLMKTIWWVYDL